MARDNYMSQREYESRREWLIDTAETPEDQKRLKKDLANLDKLYKAQQRKVGGITGAGSKSVNKVYRNMGK